MAPPDAPVELTFDLDSVEAPKYLLAMRIVRLDKMLVAGNGLPVELALPRGCVGAMLVFDDAEAAHEFIPGDLTLLSLQPDTNPKKYP